MEVLAKATGSNHIEVYNVSNQHLVHLEHTQCYMSIMFQLKFDTLALENILATSSENADVHPHVIQ